MKAHGDWSSDVPSNDPISPPTEIPPGSVFDSLTGSAAFHMNVAPFSKKPPSVDSMRPSVTCGVAPLRTLKSHAFDRRRHGPRRDRRRHERQVHEAIDAVAARERVSAVEIERC